jgi:hypothetical protein
MADVIITITIPDAYVSRVRSAIDRFDPLQNGDTYITQLKFIIRRMIKKYVYQSEVNFSVTPSGDDIVG